MDDDSFSFDIEKHQFRDYPEYVDREYDYIDASEITSKVNNDEYTLLINGICQKLTERKTLKFFKYLKLLFVFIGHEDYNYIKYRTVILYDTLFNDPNAKLENNKKLKQYWRGELSHLMLSSYGYRELIFRKYYKTVENELKKLGSLN